MPLLQCANMDARNVASAGCTGYLGPFELALQLLHGTGAFAKVVDNIWTSKNRLSLQ